MRMEPEGQVVRFLDDQPITELMNALDGKLDVCTASACALWTIMCWADEMSTRDKNRDICIADRDDESLFVSHYEGAFFYYVRKSNIIYPICVSFDPHHFPGLPYRKPSIQQLKKRSRGSIWIDVQDGDTSSDTRDLLLNVGGRRRSLVPGHRFGKVSEVGRRRFSFAVSRDGQRGKLEKSPILFDDILDNHGIKEFARTPEAYISPFMRAVEAYASANSLRTSEAYKFVSAAYTAEAYARIRSQGPDNMRVSAHSARLAERIISTNFAARISKNNY